MTFHPQTNTPIQGQTPTYSPTSSRSNAYCPSVPITVYRELATELQAAREQLELLKSQNHQLIQQNQQLCQEVSKVIHSAKNLQKVVKSVESGQELEHSSFTHLPQEPIPAPPPAMPIEAAPAPSSYLPNASPSALETPERLVMEVQERKPRRSSQQESSSEVSGWLLALAILLIVLTAFSTGFLIVRPLLSGTENSSE